MRTEVPEPFLSLIKEWCRSLRSEGKSPRTIRGYRDAACWFHAWLADDEDAPAEPRDVQTSQARAWIAHRIETTSLGNANNNYRALQQWFNWLLAEDEIDVHPMARMKPPKVPEQPVPVVSDTLMKRVLDGCKGRDLRARRDEAIIRLYWDTGARLSEIANLDLDDLDLEVDVIRVVGKGGKPRAIPFSTKTGQALSRYLRVRKQHPQADLVSALWLSDRGRGPLQANGIKLIIRRHERAHAAARRFRLGNHL
ncbi:tyrosine-type recombinase/integrase [Sciscionella marina]|uniref:tyrosine-type recombinase/integrase n=1 Tax=Sciscionella marina TaxID=508770 RepID=UPI0003671332|nr:tyrosine-type recombinase/integrase [Sciscionella marina]